MRWRFTRHVERLRQHAFACQHCSRGLGLLGSALGRSRTPATGLQPTIRTSVTIAGRVVGAARSADGLVHSGGRARPRPCAHSCSADLGDRATACALARPEGIARAFSHHAAGGLDETGVEDRHGAEQRLRSTSARIVSFVAPAAAVRSPGRTGSDDGPTLDACVPWPRRSRACTSSVEAAGQSSPSRAPSGRPQCNAVRRSTRPSTRSPRNSSRSLFVASEPEPRVNWMCVRARVQQILVAAKRIAQPAFSERPRIWRLRFRGTGRAAPPPHRTRLKNSRLQRTVERPAPRREQDERIGLVEGGSEEDDLGPADEILDRHRSPTPPSARRTRGCRWSCRGCRPS